MIDNMASVAALSHRDLTSYVVFLSMVFFYYCVCLA